MNRLRLTATVAGLVLLAGIPSAQTARAQTFTAATLADARLEVPAGWAAQTDPHGALTLTEPGASGARLLLRVHPYQPGLDAEALLQQVVPERERYDALASARSDNGEGHLVVLRTREVPAGMVAALVDPDAGRDVVTLAVLAAPADAFKRLDGVRLLTDVARTVSRRTPSAPDAPPAQTPPPPAPSGASLFVAQYLEDFNPMTGAGGWRIRTLTLFPDGACYTGMPDRPVEALDADALRAAEPERVCTWERRGDELRVHHPSLAGTDYANRTLRREGAGWRQSRTRYFLPAQPVAARQLRGHFQAEQIRIAGAYTGNPLVTAATSDAFWFYPDGRFERSLAAGVAGQTAGGSGVGTHRARVGGTYALDGTTLTLRHDDGTVLRTLAIAWPGSDAVVIGRKRYERQD